MLRIFGLVLYVSLISISLRANEGMWLPLLLSSLNEAEMQAMGMRMTAEDIYSVNQGSLKDAIVLFGGGCTGEIISKEGLILTNHHCGFDAIQKLSTVENNRLKDGFWAMSREQELRNQGLWVSFIDRIEDVTKPVLENVSNDLSVSERQSQIDLNIKSIIANTPHEAYQDVRVRPFYDGNQYFLFVTDVYRDIRLVGAPPESIGKFGADTDNWEWPRHTGDFSIFRIYADKDNKPADYSPDNVPFKPKHALPIPLGGVKEGDFTMIFGFPGLTEYYLPSYGITHVVDVLNPTYIGIRDITLKIMDREMRKDEATRLRLVSHYVGLSNSWKKWIGQLEGLSNIDVVGKKQQQELLFNQRLKKKAKLREKYGDILPQFKDVYAGIKPLEHARIYYGEILGSNVKLFQLIGRLDQLRSVYINNGRGAFLAEVEKQRSWLTEFYRGFDQAIDNEICEALLKHMAGSLEDAYLPNELITDEAELGPFVHAFYSNELKTMRWFDRIVETDSMTFVKSIESLAAHQFYTSARSVSNNVIAPGYNELRLTLNQLQRRWMAAQMEVFPEKRFWPDANRTVRVSYGKVEPAKREEGYVTYLDGLMDKYKPGDYEFDVHPKLIELHKNKNYGAYAERSTGQLPVCFLASNHTTGGNSGSPAIDADGNLIGLNFDRTWESTMSDYYFDPAICRNINVDIRYVLFVIDKFAGAGHLIREMEIVGH